MKIQSNLKEVHSIAGVQVVPGMNTFSATVGKTVLKTPWAQLLIRRGDLETPDNPVKEQQTVTPTKEKPPVVSVTTERVKKK